MPFTSSDSPTTSPASFIAWTELVVWPARRGSSYIAPTSDAGGTTVMDNIAERITGNKKISPVFSDFDDRPLPAAVAKKRFR
ncbi:hypothetical protein WKI68_19605 [Streptomyces sp. MS1.HAVA.3]|uniref:Uncharacterized protein n=1 Tax=Streptomyces caledonius TaxID=3134107 RepID=A0ABU8U533_9ACTN